MKRRAFLQSATIPLLGSATGLAGCSFQQRRMECNTMAGTVQKRPFGQTGEELSLVGFGAIAVMNEEQSDANRWVAQAVERGVNYFDVAPSYGNAQDRLGPALEPYRKGVFLACKTGERGKDGAIKELHNSLKVLRTDHIDLYQLHGLTTIEDVERVTGSNGALEAFVEAREKGQIRYIGFSVHSEEAAERVMDAYDFDSVLFPLNYVAYYQGHFGSRILRKAEEKGIACLALKALARCIRAKDKPDSTGHPKCWYEPITDPVEQELALRWTLSHNITAAVPPGHADLFFRALDIAERFTPLAVEEQADLERRSVGLEPIFRTEA